MLQKVGFHQIRNERPLARNGNPHVSLFCRVKILAPIQCLTELFLPIQDCLKSNMIQQTLCHCYHQICSCFPKKCYYETSHIITVTNVSKNVKKSYITFIVRNDNCNSPRNATSSSSTAFFWKNKWMENLTCGLKQGDASVWHRRVKY